MSQEVSPDKVKQENKLQVRYYLFTHLESGLAFTIRKTHRYLWRRLISKKISNKKF